VRRLVAEPQFREQALRVRRLYAGCDGAARAAAAITRHLAGATERRVAAQPALSEAAA
jgi:hypothetical protein